ncbi:hypothetical protein [Saccharothrix coeruleofusca]|uniref:Uncharacterized protein n=1 Tax=Saccharothrix coeruleofusca TaxID=33919 RepID=A0A918EGI1_9PSEU|nr:hypothetical protein [Saccharothrix coeruleofusca]MBP2335274.1 hypothetical protein [Saccharothrix coeruleofusca]GGP71904.1 hypothetical protein GCM10010185_51550 [Saccharothrix coeruleofusca]
MEEARSAGPSVVSTGPADAPVVVVLDPAGVAIHGELPATWRPLTDHLHVTWCRLPAADESWSEVERVFDDCAQRGVPVHLVAGAAAGARVGELATKYDGTIRSVQTFAAPIPLGHPEVVLEVLRELLGHGVDAGVDPGAQPVPGMEPENRSSSLLGDAASALRQSVRGLFDRLRDG